MTSAGNAFFFAISSSTAKMGVSKVLRVKYTDYGRKSIILWKTCHENIVINMMFLHIWFHLLFSSSSYHHLQIILLYEHINAIIYRCTSAITVQSETDIISKNQTYFPKIKIPFQISLWPSCQIFFLVGVPNTFNNQTVKIGTAIR